MQELAEGAGGGTEDGAEGKHGGPVRTISRKGYWEPGVKKGGGWVATSWWVMLLVLEGKAQRLAGG